MFCRPAASAVKFSGSHQAVHYEPSAMKKNQTPNLHIRLQLMQLLAENPRLSQREMSRKMGVALGSINYCLSGLVEKGFIKLESFKGATNHLRYAYILTPSGIEEKMRMTVHFLKRRLKEYEEIRTQIQDLSRDVARADPTLLDDLDLKTPFNT
jgi:EPS-associated MarR family transcriptional regulator